MIEEFSNKFVDIKPYLLPATEKLLNEIELNNPFKVHLRKVYDPIKSWQINSLIPYMIDMPAWDEENVNAFTHELLHIYFDYALGMHVNHFALIDISRSYGEMFGETEKWHVPNYYISLINNLQHYKMVPYFVEYGLPLNKIIDNYENPISIFENFDNTLRRDFNFQNVAVSYVLALEYVNFLALELYFPNPEIRKIIKNKYSFQFDKRYTGLRSIFQPILTKWENIEFNDLLYLINEIHSLTDEFVQKKCIA